MESEIIVAIIGAVSSFVGALIACITTQNKTIYRIEQLEHKVDKHNSMIERTYVLEAKVANLEHRD